MKSKKPFVLLVASMLALVACNFGNNDSKSSSNPSGSSESSIVNPDSSSGDGSSSGSTGIPSSSSQPGPSSSSQPGPGPSSSSNPSSSSSSEAPVITGIAAKVAGTKGITLAVGEEGGIEVEVQGTGDFNKAVNWSIADPTVASVSDAGLLKGLKIGETKLTAAAAGDPTKKVEFDVEVVKATAVISVNVTDVELQPDEEETLKASVKVTGELADTIVFESSNPAVAEVDENGKITANAVGEATITVKSADSDENNWAKVYVRVNEPYVKTVALSADSIYLRVGEDQTLNASINEFGEPVYDVEWLSSNPAVATVDENGKVTAVAEGNAVISVTAGGAKAECDVVVAAADAKQAADGAFSYVYASGEDRQNILGALEKWAVENKLTGLTLYGDGGYVMYNTRIQKGTENYLPGYGFGILGEGSIKSDLEAETNPDWKRYYHSYETSDPSSLNYMDDKGSVVGDLIGYVTSGYFDTKMNNQKTGYVWVNALSESANNRPIPMDLSESTGMAKTYRIPLKVGDAMHYATLSKNSEIAKYNGREVALEDYLTPYKIYYTKAYGLARSAENLEGASSISGSKEYYNASADGFNAKAWEGIGIKVLEDAGKSYIEFKFNNACTPFYAMYYLTSGMFAPVPESFITLLGNGDFAKGVETWGKNSKDASLSPADTFLSTGPYVTERWDKDDQIVFKKNELYEEDIDDMRYDIPGVHLNILPAAANDPEAAFNEFIAGKIDASGIPSTKLAEFKSDPRTTTTTDSSTYKLNMNTCTQEQWELLFGENGSIVKTPKSQYWKCEPAMSNKDFLSGISFALNRKELAESLGRTPTGNFFGASYMQDPENGISYNSTQAHADAVKSLQEGTDGFGYNLQLAKAAFSRASEQLIADGIYKAGDTIEIEIAWQTKSQESTTHNPIKSYIEAAFEGNPLKINVKFHAGAVWSDVYYKKMMVGQFDIGFGSVSGNTYNPLNFMEVLRSDNSAGFTLNWGVDTNSVDGTLVYNDLVWSYDALWKAADQGAIVSHGQEAPFWGLNSAEVLKQADGSILVVLYVDETIIDNDTYGYLGYFCIYATTDGDKYSDYSEYYFFPYLADQNGVPVDENGDPLAEGVQPIANPNWTYNEEKGCYEIKISKAFIDAWMAAYPQDKVAAQGFDAYFCVSFLGEVVLSAYGTDPYVAGFWTGRLDKLP